MSHIVLPSPSSVSSGGSRPCITTDPRLPRCLLLLPPPLSPKSGSTRWVGVVGAYVSRDSVDEGFPSRRTQGAWISFHPRSVQKHPTNGDHPSSGKGWRGIIRNFSLSVGPRHLRRPSGQGTKQSSLLYLREKEPTDTDRSDHRR